MSSIDFKVNNKVEIMSEDEIFTSDIQDVQDNYIAISIPIRDFQYLPLRKDEKIKVLYYEGNNIYKFSSTVIKRSKSNIPLLWINIPEKIEKIQRRKFVRVPVLQKVRYALIDRNLEFNKENIARIKFEMATVLDLSGGGVRLKSEISINKGDVLALILPVGDGVILVKGEIRRSDTDEAGEMVYGVNFMELKNAEQEKIIKFVFQIMREQMKKGLKEEK